MQQASHEAAILLEHIEDRQAEIKDLEDSAQRTCVQLERLLTLKQQQASIVEAKAALRRADESVKQGRAIMAFTLVTIFFLPLGFIATFFGMNNREINNSDWMSLNEQIRYMFVVTVAVVIVIVVGAFSAWPRAFTRLLVHVPFVWFGEETGLYSHWKDSPVHHEKLDRHAYRFLTKIELRKYKKKKESKNGKENGKAGDSDKSTTAADNSNGIGTEGNGVAPPATNGHSKRAEGGGLLKNPLGYLRSRKGNLQDASIA